MRRIVALIALMILMLLASRDGEKLTEAIFAAAMMIVVAMPEKEK